MDKAIAKLYYDASGAGSFGGVERFYKRALAANVAGVSRDKVRAFLAAQQAYTLTGQRVATTSEIRPMRVESTANGRPTWRTCVRSLTRMMAPDTF